MTSTPPLTVWILAGPTASGKSALAIELCKNVTGAIINADSMQVYTEIPIISAQPSAQDHHAIPHYLYGHIPITQRMSATQWAHQAVHAITACHTKGLQPILVGGSGLYLKTLVDGLSPVPEVSIALREQICELYDLLGPTAFHDALMEIDPTSAKRLHPTDRQRTIRAREVFEASGKPLSHWQSLPKQAIGEEFTYRMVTLLPDREWLYARINQRFESMIRHGALDEARAVHALNPDPTLTGVQALGLQALRDYLDDRTTLLEAIDQAQTHSRQYAKRQYTWFKGQALHRAVSLVVDTLPDSQAIQSFYQNK